MINFIAEAFENNSYVKIPGTVFPLSYANLLDERLDEAYLHCVSSPVKRYKTLTKVRIKFYSNGMKDADGNTKEPDRIQYYIVANDTSVEIPAGKKRYDHDIYLIEYTKMLEGYLCQSITFTNTLGNFYTNYQTKIAPDVDGNSLDISNAKGKFPELDSPVDSSKPYTIRCIIDIANKTLLENVKFQQIDYSYLGDHSSIVVKDANNDTTISELICENSSDLLKELTVNLPANTEISLQYHVLYFDGQATVYYCDLIYNLVSVENQYPTKPWTITACVNRVLDLAEPIFHGEAPRYTFNAAQAEKYDQIYAPEFSMTQCTLREQLKVIGGYIHAEPRLLENDEIVFEEYGNTEISPVGGLPYVFESTSCDINQYCTDIRTNASNLVNSLGYAQGVVIDPADGFFRSLRTETQYARVTDENGICMTQFPVYSVRKLECGILSAADGVAFALPMLDITPYVFEATRYSANLSDYAGGYPSSKQYAVYFTRGQKNIRGLFYQVPNALNTAALSRYAIVNILAACTSELTDAQIDSLVTKNPENLVFRVTYDPIYSTYLSHGKQLHIAGETNYTQIYNQSGNLIETTYFGENLKGAAARLGNVEQERTYILGKFSDIPKAGQLLDEEYAISAVNTEVMPTYIKCTLALSKDFNRISQYVGISSNKRTYEVSESAAYRRDILLKEYLIVGSAEEAAQGKAKIFHPAALNGFAAIFGYDPGTAGGPTKPITVAVAAGKGMKKDGNGNKVPGDALNRIILPTVSGAFGNTVVFNFSYKDNYSAGDRVQKVNGDDSVTGYWQTDVRYTDLYGRMYYLAFGLYASVPGVKQTAYDLPLYENSEAVIESPISTEVGAPLIIRKDSREQLSVNVECEIKTTKKDVNIGSALAYLCRFVYTGEYVQPRLYLNMSRKNLFGKFDRKITDTSALEDLGLVKVEKSEDGNSFRIVPKTVPNLNGQTFSGWVIAIPPRKTQETVQDEDGTVQTIDIYSGGDILLSHNAPLTTPIQPGDTVPDDFVFYFKR